MGFDPFLNNAKNEFGTINYDLLNKKNIKIIMMHDDLHGFSVINNKITLNDIIKGDKKIGIF